MTTNHEQRSASRIALPQYLLLPAILLGMGLSANAVAQDNAALNAEALGELSLEELVNIDITSVSKRPERLSQAPAAIYVITRQDISRAGVSTLADALRLAPNLQVAQLDASQFTIGARGFNISNVNKLLVLIDGRTVYTPLFAGVFWDAQDVLLEDIERIEVISGPGGTLWGSNAVNGIINILTRHTRDTQGELLAGGAGNEARAAAAFRHGGQITDAAYYRMYAKYTDMDASAFGNGGSAADGWRRVQAGMRLDRQAASDALTFSADAYRGEFDQSLLDDRTIDGANIVARWQRTFSTDSNLSLQAYIDRTEREHPQVFAETLTTYDIELQHHFKPAERHRFVWGAGYRAHNDQVRNSGALMFLPAHKRLQLANVFAQDSITLVDERLLLTLGVKLEHNSYTGWETQPSTRLSWTINAENLLWAAISRAVRTPSRLDRELYVFQPGLTLAGGPEFQSESVLAHELGFRTQPSEQVALSISTFYNDYDDLRTLELDASNANTFVIGNRMLGQTHGLEVWGDWLPNETWRFKAGYAYLDTDLRLAADSTDLSGVRGAGNDARHRWLLSSAVQLRSGLELDATLRHVDSLPNPKVPAYTELDLRLAWRPHERLQIALIGRNLLDSQHAEFGAANSRREVERAAFLKVEWTF